MTLYFVNLFLLCVRSYVDLSKTRYHSLRSSGGELAEFKGFPYQLALERLLGKNYVQCCSAAIIHDNWALTAANCVYRYNQRELRLHYGSGYRESGTLHYIQRIIIHPDYNAFNKDYDVSVIKVFTPFGRSNAEQSILMASKTPSAGTPAMVTGRGGFTALDSISRELQQAEVTIMDYEWCKQRISMTPRMLCAAKEDNGACIGDAGGPVVVNNTLVGIVSFERTCRGPVVYTNVAKIRNWTMFSILEDLI